MLVEDGALSLYIFFCHDDMVAVPTWLCVSGTTGACMLVWYRNLSMSDLILRLTPIRDDLL